MMTSSWAGRKVLDGKCESCMQMKPLVNLMDITTHVSHKIAVHWISVDQLERGDYKNVGAEK